MEKRAVPVIYLLAAGMVFSISHAAPSNDTFSNYSYAIVVSSKTYSYPRWQNVVNALREKHQGVVIEYQKNPWESLPALRRYFPQYICFVTRPQEASRNFVITAHRLTRQLDADPYTDAIWGILTGYSADDALRIAQYNKPLVIRRALSGTDGVSLQPFEDGLQFSESSKGLMREKIRGREVKKSCPDDTTLYIVKALNEFKPDVFFTSGHATDQQWQIGYTYKNGYLRSHKGRLLGVDTQRKIYLVDSSNPKVQLSIGNCLMGRITDHDCMVLSLLHSAGVYQMLGYTVVTFFGYGGWGVNDFFLYQAGRFSLAEANYCNNVSLVYALVSKYPRAVKVQPKFAEYTTNAVWAMEHKYSLARKESLGLVWDRDVVAFYGDPAWDARLEKRTLAWGQQLREKDGVFTLTLKTRIDGGWGNRPVIQLLPYRIKDVKLLAGGQYKPVITDNFILVPMKDKYTKGQIFRISFMAKPVLAADKLTVVWKSN